MPTPEGVVYSVDDGRTKFYDLLQLVEFYQLNAGTLPTRYAPWLLVFRLICMNRLPHTSQYLEAISIYS